jgi:hypothetical protein
MMNQPTLPAYLPAVNRRLEYQAGLLSATARPVADIVAAAAESRPWLGTDFTHIIVTR